MTNHFRNRNSAIKCVQHYPSISAQKQRFLSLRWKTVIVKTIEEIWKYYINESEQKRLNEIEPFDESAELILKCLHYVLIVGINSKNSQSVSWFKNIKF